MGSFLQCTYLQTVFLGMEMFVICKNRAAVEKDEETKVDKKPISQFVLLDEVLKSAKNRLLQRQQNFGRCNQFNLRTHDGWNRIGSKSIDIPIKELRLHPKSLLAANTF